MLVLRAGGLPDGRFQQEAATGEAFFLEAGGEPCRWLPSGGRLHGGAFFLLAGGRAGRCQEAGGGLPGSALPGAVLRAGGRSRGARSAGRTEARSADIGAGGTALDLALAREALRNPTPSRRRHQRGCSRAHDNAFAGGAVCLELGSPCLFCQTGLRLSGHCGPGWRWTAGARRWGGGVVGWWSRIGDGAAVWSRPVGCGKGRRTAQVGLPRLSPSLCLGR